MKHLFALILIGAYSPWGFSVTLKSPDLVKQLLVTPSTENHQAFLDAIHAAKKSIRMTMYHLSDENVVEALIAAAAPLAKFPWK